ncbi:MAG: MOSC domain-containing protein [Alphaproteobacteria bacterium]
MPDSVHVSALFIYPVKGCLGVALEQSPIGPRGLAFDREWLVVDSNGKFITQRSHPGLTQVHVEVSDGGLRLWAEGMGTVTVAPDYRGDRMAVQIWCHTLDAVAQTAEADAFFSDLLDTKLQLVRFAEDVVRPCNPAFAKAGDHTAFSDGYPLLVTSETSLDRLNETIVKRGGSAVPMNRFRPNIVVAGAPADSEDSNLRLVIGGDMVIDLVKPCSRCLVTTTDQKTGARMGKEPLASLATTRQGLLGGDDREVYFGQNGVARVDAAESHSINVGESAAFIPR